MLRHSAIRLNSAAEGGEGLSDGDKRRVARGLERHRQTIMDLEKR